MNLRGIPLMRAGDRELQVYNHLVLQNQDEAFSLAYDLLGEPDAADALVQQVFLKGFDRRKAARLSFRLQALRWVVRACLARGGPLPGPAQLDPRLARLSNEENVALLLVDRLALTYSEAAVVMQKSTSDFAKTLASIRFSLSKMSETAQP